MKRVSDYRSHPSVEKLRREVPQIKHAPLIDRGLMGDIAYIMQSMPALEYPINSAGELISKYVAPGQKLRIAGMNFDPVTALQQMPAYYFPMASAENFAEKLAEMIRMKRRTVVVPAEMVSIRKQLASLRFPIRSASHLLRMREAGKKYYFRGREVDPEAMVRRIPPSLFPMTSRNDFERKIASLLAQRI